MGGSRGLACEFVASDLLTCLSGNEALEYLCYELPLVRNEDCDDGNNSAGDERAGLLGGHGSHNVSSSDLEADSIASYAGLNTLEIAILADAKKFLSHRPVRFTLSPSPLGSLERFKLTVFLGRACDKRNVGLLVALGK